MRVLMLNRPNMYKVPGGDTVQLLKTKEKLEKLGVEVDVSNEIYPKKIDLYDIVHIFNVTRISECYLQFWYAKRKGKKVIISPIYHSKEQLRYYEKNILSRNNKFVKVLLERHELLEFIKAALRTVKNPQSIIGLFKQAFIGYNNMQKSVLSNADAILPNSLMEYEFLKKELGLNIGDKKLYIVPNAVEMDFEIDSVDEKKFKNKYNLSNFILCAGRIEPLKNQIGIIEALKESSYEIVFAGRLNKKHKSYCNKFMEYIKSIDNIHYVGQLDEEMLLSAYKNAKVTIIASWFETTGLVGLEAAKMGSSLVITDRGYTKEYYEDYVEYCSPSKPSSILNAVNNAVNNSTVDYRLIEKLSLNYNWNNTGEVTKRVYENLIMEEF